MDAAGLSGLGTAVSLHRLVATPRLEAVGAWFRESILDTGRLPLFCFFVAFVLTFLFIRFSVRMIRAQVSWWPGNITPGGLHIHHVVFGTVTMVVGGVAGLAVPLEPVIWRAICASLFGVGTSLVLDEFALILHLDDVYWSEEGRLSVDAVAMAAGLTGLLVLGGAPILADLSDVDDQNPLIYAATVVVVVVLDLALAAVTVLKGKVWTGLFGLFVPVLLLVGAVRLARPASIWARQRYRTTQDRPGRPDKMARAVRRECRYREPLHRLKLVLQDAVAGAPNRPLEPGPPAPESADDQQRQTL
jgi:hypothetical protein